MPACSSGALRPIELADAVMGTAEVDRESCVSWTGAELCSRCVEVCPFGGNAILADEESRPYVDPRHCIGCGLCQHECPVKDRAAIRVTAAGESRAPDGSFFLR